MKLEAIYDRGRLEFSTPVMFKSDRVRIKVEVPDSEIVHPPDKDHLPQELHRQAEDMLARLEAIRNAPLPSDDQVPEVTPKQLERIEAFELRAQSREEQGRPV
ncbi:MAG: hypothetical protein R6U38_03865 [Desulfatiglandaceae bacterium]